MHLKGIMLSERSQTKTNIVRSHMWNIKHKTNEQTKQNRNRPIDTENKLVVTRGEGGGGLLK